MNNLAIIPARGGSKRIPKKNTKPFLGIPIIEYSIKAALDSDIFQEVMVSTDDHEIAEIATKSGAVVPFIRSVENSNDYATLYDVVYEVLNWYKAKKIDFEAVSCIMATCPFLKPEQIIEAHSILCQDETDSVLPVVKFDYPIQRALKKNKKGHLNFCNLEDYKTRSQDLEETYHDAGMFYFTKVNSFLKKNNNRLSSGSIKPFLINSFESQDIDTIEDWNIAEMKFKILEKNVR
ncbi:pseudaminic acid cytidylyltransferase [Aquimarina rubra]|uniref:Pseudaminic acid cytidylyltransferase n=1 Tax=Aquimarina rubra TaxID=1920033 RepID=A0ABW5LHC8_9FLAO